MARNRTGAVSFSSVCLFPRLSFGSAQVFTTRVFIDVFGKQIVATLPFGLEGLDGRLLVQHVQTALTQMTTRLARIIAEVAGETGQKILRATIAG